MSSSKSKFLLDENVRIELAECLQQRGVDAVRVPQGLKNGRIAALSLREGRVVVTNDVDFRAFPADAIQGVVWLQIPQDAPEVLVRTMAKLLESGEALDGRLVVVQPDRWETLPLRIKTRTPFDP